MGELANICEVSLTSKKDTPSMKHFDTHVRREKVLCHREMAVASLRRDVFTCPYALTGEEASVFCRNSKLRAGTHVICFRFLSGW